MLIAKDPFIFTMPSKRSAHLRSLRRRKHLSSTRLMLVIGVGFALSSIVMTWALPTIPICSFTHSRFRPSRTDPYVAVCMSCNRNLQRTSCQAPEDIEGYFLCRYMQSASSLSSAAHPLGDPKHLVLWGPTVTHRLNVSICRF